MWPSQSSSIEAQQSDQPVLQITLQEVISMIDSRVPIGFGKYRTELTVILVRSVNFIKIYRTEWFGNYRSVQ